MEMHLPLREVLKYVFCFSPWKYLSKTRRDLYDRLRDSGWKKLGCIYVWASGAKTLCSVKINHLMAAAGLSPTDWVSPRRCCGAQPSYFIRQPRAGRSASRSLFPRFLLRLVNWQLEATAICVPVSWKMLVTLSGLEREHKFSRGVESTSELLTWSAVWIQSWLIFVSIRSIATWRSWLERSSLRFLYVALILNISWTVTTLCNVHAQFTNIFDFLFQENCLAWTCFRLLM